MSIQSPEKNYKTQVSWDYMFNRVSHVIPEVSHGNSGFIKGIYIGVTCNPLDFDM